MDGDCVKSWCTAALEREQGHLLQGLARGLPSLAALGDLHRHVGRLAALVTVLEALAEPQQGAAGGAAGADAGSTLPLALARQLHQCVQVGCLLKYSLLSSSTCSRSICSRHSDRGMHKVFFGRGVL